MGCYPIKSKKKNEKDNVTLEINDNPPQSPAKKQNTPIDDKKKNDNHKEIISNIKDFKVTKENLVTEKTGKISQEYKILNDLGSGGYGKVQRALHLKTNIIRAIKIINKESSDEEEQERLVNEVNILRTLDHPNIMKIVEFYQDSRHFYIVSEFYNGGELFGRILEYKCFNEKEAALIMKQIFSAVYYCHQNKIVHRDLKPENILYESSAKDSLLKIIDFGTSRFYNPDQKMNQKYGTAYYIAPEVLKRKYNEKCDLWSCGVILFILLCGYPPFNGDSDKEILDRVVTGKYDFNQEEWAGISEDAKNLIKKLLETNVNLRYNAEQALNDKWIKQMSRAVELDQPIALNALNNLKSFRAERKLQEATWMFLATYMSTRDEKAELLKTFQALDINGDGKLTREELLTGYQNILGHSYVEHEINAIFDQVDTNASGTIDYTEFVMGTINRKKLLSKDRLESAFKLFDKDGNGFLEINEIKAMFNSGGSKEIDEQVWVELIREVDPNSDGKISLVEFKEMMMKLK